MEKWTFKPLESVGKIKFGMDREEVHKLFDEKCTEFKKTKFSNNTTDAYKKFHVYYTSDNKVDAVEFFEGIELLLDNELIFPIKADDIEKRIPGIEKDGDYYTHYEKSIGIETEEGDSICILVGAEGYYN